MSISIYSIKQNLSDLNSHKDSLPKEVRDAIERVTDDAQEMIEKLDEIVSGIEK